MPQRKFFLHSHFFFEFYPAAGTVGYFCLSENEKDIITKTSTLLKHMVHVVHYDISFFCVCTRVSVRINIQYAFLTHKQNCNN